MEEPALLTGSHLTLLQLRVCLKKGWRALSPVWARYALTFFLYTRRMENPCTLSAGDNLHKTHMHAFEAVHLFCSLPGQQQQQREPRCKRLWRCWEWRNRRNAEVEVSLTVKYCNAFSIKSHIITKCVIFPTFLLHLLHYYPASWLEVVL